MAVLLEDVDKSEQKYGIKSYNFYSDFEYISNNEHLLPLYVLTSKVPVVEFCHGISLKYSDSSL